MRVNGQKERKPLSAQEKCRAVLAVWREQRTASELCRQMGIRASRLAQWQEAAMAGMLAALEPTLNVAPGSKAHIPLARRAVRARSAGEPA